MKLHRFFIIFLSLLLITCDMRADGGDVLERIIRLPGTKGTVYSLLSKVSEQSGYLFVYDSKVVNNDIEVRTKKKNCTVLQYLENVRLKKARELLETSSLSISDISLMVGYNDPNYFARSFKKVYELTPREYRNICGEE